MFSMSLLTQSTFLVMPGLPHRVGHYAMMTVVWLSVRLSSYEQTHIKLATWRYNFDL